MSTDLRSEHRSPRRSHTSRSTAPRAQRRERGGGSVNAGVSGAPARGNDVGFNGGDIHDDGDWLLQ